MIEYKLAKNNIDINNCFKIRNLVFVIEQGISKEIEFDNEDDKALHFIVYNDELPVATLRVLINNEKAHIGRVCVLKEYRNKSIGSSLLINIESYLKKINIKEIYLYAQIQAINFYTKIGYKQVGNSFYEANIEHIKMIKNL